MRLKAFLLVILILLLSASCSAKAPPAPAAYWQVLAKTTQGTQLAWDGTNYYVVQHDGRREQVMLDSGGLIVGPAKFSFAGLATGSIDPSAKLDQMILSAETVESLGYKQEVHNDSGDGPTSTWWGGPSSERYCQMLGPTDGSADHYPLVRIQWWRYTDESKAQHYLDSLAPFGDSEIRGWVGPHRAKAFVSSELGITGVYWADGTIVVGMRGWPIKPTLVEAVYQASIEGPKATGGSLSTPLSSGGAPSTEKDHDPIVTALRFVDSLLAHNLAAMRALVSPDQPKLVESLYDFRTGHGGVPPAIDPPKVVPKQTVQGESSTSCVILVGLLYGNDIYHYRIQVRLGRSSDNGWLVNDVQADLVP